MRIDDKRAKSGASGPQSGKFGGVKNRALTGVNCRSKGLARGGPSMGSLGFFGRVPIVFLKLSKVCYTGRCKLDTADPKIGKLLRHGGELPKADVFLAEFENKGGDPDLTQIPLLLCSPMPRLCLA